MTQQVNIANENAA